MPTAEEYVLFRASAWAYAGLWWVQDGVKVGLLDTDSMAREILHCLLTQDFWKMMAKETNWYVEQRPVTPSSHVKTWENMTAEELQSFIGLHLLLCLQPRPIRGIIGWSPHQCSPKWLPGIDLKPCKVASTSQTTRTPMLTPTVYGSCDWCWISLMRLSRRSMSLARKLQLMSCCGRTGESPHYSIQPDEEGVVLDKGIPPVWEWRCWCWQYSAFNTSMGQDLKVGTHGNVNFRTSATGMLDMSWMDRKQMNMLLTCSWTAMVKSGLNPK